MAKHSRVMSRANALFRHAVHGTVRGWHQSQPHRARVVRAVKASWNWLREPNPTPEHRNVRRGVLAGVFGAGVIAAALYGRAEFSKLRVPKPHFKLTAVMKEYNKPGANCADFVETKAQDLFGVNFREEDAWFFARVNRSVWQKGVHDKQYPVEQLRPGYVVGIYRPASKKYNRIAAEAGGRPYTHLALVMGFEGNEPVVLHYFGDQVRVDYLNRFVEAEGDEVREIIAPWKDHL